MSTILIRIAIIVASEMRQLGNRGWITHVKLVNSDFWDSNPGNLHLQFVVLNTLLSLWKKKWNEKLTMKKHILLLSITKHLEMWFIMWEAQDKTEWFPKYQRILFLLLYSGWKEGTLNDPDTVLWASLLCHQAHRNPSKCGASIWI